MAKNHQVSDGETVQITLMATKEKGTPWYQDKFHGFICEDGSSGDSVALDIALREWQVNIGQLTAGKGDVIYINITSGALSNTNTDRPFARVSQAKDANNVAWLVLLPQCATEAELV